MHINKGHIAKLSMNEWRIESRLVSSKSKVKLGLIEVLIRLYQSRSQKMKLARICSNPTKSFDHNQSTNFSSVQNGSD